jgi:hypothetical protein
MRPAYKSYSYTSRGIRHVEEVFVISQYWGEGFYHSTAEDIPRMALYLEFLRVNTHIKIHAISYNLIKNMLKLFGINHKSRVVGGTVRADIVYLPRGGGCGGSRACYLSLQVMASAFRNPPNDVIGPTSDSPSKQAVDANTPPYSVKAKDVKHISSAKNQLTNIVLIRRRSKRYLSNHDDVYDLLQKIAKDFGLQVIVFGDRPLPAFNKTLSMYQNAVAVVAPHGAGLSNIVFAPPGTTVIEVLVKHSVNLCYMTLSYYLGHRYHGMLSKSNSNALKANIPYLDNVLRTFLSKGHRLEKKHSS